MDTGYMEMSVAQWTMILGSKSRSPAQGPTISTTASSGHTLPQYSDVQQLLQGPTGCPALSVPAADNYRTEHPGAIKQVSHGHLGYGHSHEYQSLVLQIPELSKIAITPGERADPVSGYSMVIPSLDEVQYGLEHAYRSMSPLHEKTTAHINAAALSPSQKHGHGDDTPQQEDKGDQHPWRHNCTDIPSDQEVGFRFRDHTDDFSRTKSLTSNSGMRILAFRLAWAYRDTSI